MRPYNLVASFPLSLSSAYDNTLRDSNGQTITVSILTYTNTSYNFPAYNYGANFDQTTNDYITVTAAADSSGYCIYTLFY